SRSREISPSTRANLHGDGNWASWPSSCFTHRAVDRKTKEFRSSIMRLCKHEAPRLAMSAQEAGYSVIELALVVAILGILTALATPSFLTYYQATTLRSAAEQIAAAINQGRQLGIRQNTGVCVHIGSTALQYQLGTSCGGAAWVGTGTDGSGNVAAPS